VKNIPARLAEAIEERGVNPKALSREVGCSYGHMRAVLAGKTVPSTITLMRAAKFFGRTVESLLVDKEEDAQ
jgi:transcriptional regulator with XRE-family HTH domain